jgi:ketosteroid isomerase-like protein
VAHPNEVLVRGAYAAFGSGDMDTLRNQYFTEDIRWHLTGRNLLTGDYVGMAQILELFGRVFELSGGTYSGEPHDVLANDELAVVLVTQRAEGAGKRWEDNSVQVIHIRERKWTETWVYPADQYAVDEFWS